MLDLSLANKNNMMSNVKTPHSNIHMQKSQQAVLTTQPISPAMTTQPHYRLPKVSITKQEPQNLQRHSLTGAHSSSSYSRSPTQSFSSSFCDNTSAISEHTSRSHQLPPDPEHDILENWFEVEFQQQFKRLNGLIGNSNGLVKSNNVLGSNTFVDDSSEILFLRQKMDQRLAPNHFVIPLSTSSTSHSLALNGSSSVNQSQEDSTQLTSWLMGRRAGGSGPEATLNNQTIHEERAFEPVVLRPKKPKNGKPGAVSPTPDHNWIASRLLQIEQLLQWDAIPVVAETASNFSNLICFAITEPNEKSNRVESILYAYPPAETEQSKVNGSNLLHLSSVTNKNTSDPTLVKLGGMFITLSEIINILRISTQNQKLNQQLQSVPMQTCCQLQVISTIGRGNILDENTYFNDKMGKSKHHQPTSLAKNPTLSQTYLFTILRYTFCPESLMSMDTVVDVKYAKTKKPPTILLLVGLPKDNGFTENDSKCVAQLLEQALVHRFKTVQAAFESYFRSTPGSYQPTSHLLNRCCLLLDILTSPPPNFFSNSNLTEDNSQSTLEAQLTLTNTFFSFSGNNTPTAFFPLQHLPFDESASLQTCKLLNYFDSLDWLDEAIGRFYRRDSINLEHALSEHLSRCLQWPADLPNDNSDENLTLVTTTTSTKPKEMSTSFMSQIDSAKNNHSQQLHKNNNDCIANEQTQLFDLLEVELSSFVIIGSAIFYRGLLVQSNITHSMLNYVHQTLWSKGFSALTKFLTYDLLYFTKIDETHLEPSTNPKAHTFLMVLGQGHVLHCTLFQVFAFDRSSHVKIDFYKTPSCANGSVNKQQTAKSISSSLPSSFAFYVFIKESFRFLCFHLHCLNNAILSERIDTHLEQSLENNYRFGLQISAENFLMINNNNSKKAKKTLQKMIKEKRSQSEKRKSVGSFALETKAYPTNAHKSSFHKTSGQASSVPSTPVKTRPQSMYSNWSFTGSNYTVNSSDATSTASSVTSLTESCQCSERQSVPLSGQLSCPANTYDLLLTSSVYRFSHRYLWPESLILYLNIEPTRQQETFYGPILDGGQLFACQMTNEMASHSSFSEAQMLLSQQNPQLISSVTTELVAEIRHFQTRLLKLAELDWSRQKEKPFPMKVFSPFISGHIVTLHYNLITGKRITVDHISTSNSSNQMPTLTTSFKFYLLGRCFCVDANKPVDQFYACFKINNSKNNETVNEIMTKSNRSSRWSLGKLSLKLDIKSSSSFSPKKNSNFGIGLLDRSNEYETIRLDNLRVDFEELMETVRYNCAN